jgi:hypothetical protein
MEVNREEGETADIGHWTTHQDVTVRVQRGHIVAAMEEWGSKAMVWVEGLGESQYDGTNWINNIHGIPVDYSPYDLFIGGKPQDAVAEVKAEAP